MNNQTTTQETATTPAIWAETVPAPPSVFQRFLRNKLAVGSAIILTTFYLIVIFVPLAIPVGETTKMDLGKLLSPPSLSVPFGTDEFGRNAFYRALYGGRVSLMVGLAAAALTACIGIMVGSLSGYRGGRLDMILMRFTDLVISLPSFLIIVLAAAVTRPSAWTIIFLIGLLRWTTMARLVRGEFLSLRQREFVEAARAAGNSHAHIVIKEILPNALAPIIVQGTLSIAFAILTESSISFLGLGIQPPVPSWGNMLSKAQGYLFQAPWLAFFPGLLIFITVLCFNLLGDGLRDALDPRLRQ